MFKTSKAAAALATALFAPATWAQNALPSGDDTVAELPSVTVTARKREESLQTVPISMRVLDGSAIRLDSAPGNSNAGLARAVPNVSFADTGGQYGNLFVIRGVGAFAPLSADDTSVVMYFDEVPRSVYGTPPTLMDVERVEVLRGPQGTLFGRNTQGGAINVIPNAPEFKRAFSVTAEGGSHGYGLGELMANTPLSESVAARLVMRYSSQDGTIPNVAAGGKDGGTQVGAARASVLWLAGDNTAVTFTGFYDRRDSDAPRFLWYQNPDFPQSAADPAGDIRWRDSGLSMRIEHDMASVKLTSLTSYQANDSRQPFDLTDGLIYSAMTSRPRNLYDQAYADFADIHFREKTFQQELRLSSLEDGRFNWTAGLNFFHSRFDNDTDTVASPAAFNFQAQNGQQKNRLSSSSLAAFGEGTLALTDKLKTTLGLRYTRERKHADYEFTGNGNPAVVAYSQHDMRMSDGFLTGRAGLSYEWTPDLMSYATVSRGAVAGGYPVTQTNGQTGKAEVPYERSTSWTYEAGVKSMWLERRLAVNASVFFNDVKNGHLIVFDPTQALFTTASLDYQSKGFELETEASLSSSLTLTAGIGYTHAELVDVPTGSSTGARNGNRVPNMPKINGSLALRYNAPMQIGAAQGRLKADLAWQYVGKRAVDVKESFELPGYGVVNARLGWQQNNWEVYAFAWNLFDKQYLVAGQAWTANVSSVRLGQPRIVGLGTTIRF